MALLSSFQAVICAMSCSNFHAVKNSVYFLFSISADALIFYFFLEKGGRENNTFLVLSINLCINEKQNYSTVFERNFMHIPFEE